LFHGQLHISCLADFPAPCVLLDRLSYDDNEPLADEEIRSFEHFGRYDEEPYRWRIDEASAEYQDRERNR
jgi:hypothetical protein